MKIYTDLTTDIHSICIYLCILFTKGLYFIMVKLFMEFVYGGLPDTRDTLEVENLSLLQVEDAIKQNVPLCPRLS